MEPTPSLAARTTHHVPPITAGILTVLVGFTGSAILIYQAVTAMGGTSADASSWLFALCMGMGLTGSILSYYYKVPIITAWTTPGAALLVTALPGVPLSEAIGAFVISAFLIVLFGVTGWFEKFMKKIPSSIASAMLAGILLRFGIGAFASIQAEAFMVLSMFVTYIVMKRWKPRYAILCVLIVGVAIASGRGLLKLESFHLEMAHPIFTMPTFSIATFFGIALPLFIVTMASQNIPGIAILRASGYSPPISPLITWTGLSTLVFAPFGSFGVSIAAITAAISLGHDAHEDASKRYVAGIVAGVGYLIVGVFSATVATLFAAFPEHLIHALAGLALMGAIGTGLKVAMLDDRDRESALITFLITSSGLTLFGIGSAFWGLIGGSISLFVLTYRKRT